MSSSATTDPPRARASRAKVLWLSSAGALAVVLVVVVSLLTGGTVTATPCQALSTLVGSKINAFHVTGLSGGTVRAPWAHQRPGVVIFFASWCEPCKSEMPKVTAYLRAHDVAPVQVVGVDALDASPSAQRFVARDRVAFPVAFDPNGSLTSGVFKFQTLPETVFVDATGTVRVVYYGAIPTGCLQSDIATIRSG
jgi:thiol-disulfide isomerase/thioredoxin